MRQQKDFTQVVWVASSLFFFPSFFSNHPPSRRESTAAHNLQGATLHLLVRDRTSNSEWHEDGNTVAIPEICTPTDESHRRTPACTLTHTCPRYPPASHGKTDLWACQDACVQQTRVSSTLRMCVFSLSISLSLSISFSLSLSQHPSVGSASSALSVNQLITEMRWRRSSAPLTLSLSLSYTHTYTHTHHCTVHYTQHFPSFRRTFVTTDATNGRIRPLHREDFFPGFCCCSAADLSLFSKVSGRFD